MVLICLANTADRLHGFLRSTMLNVHPGVYVAVDLDAGSRQRIWEILRGWYEAEPLGTAIMTFPAKDKPMDLDFETLGMAKRDICEYEDHYALVRCRQAPDQSVHEKCG